MIQAIIGGIIGALATLAGLQLVGKHRVSEPAPEKLVIPPALPQQVHEEIRQHNPRSDPTKVPEPPPIEKDAQGRPKGQWVDKPAPSSKLAPRVNTDVDLFIEELNQGQREDPW